MISRITLATLAVATIAFSAPADARGHRTAQFGPMFDAAAAPAYPMERQARTRHGRRQAVRHRRERVRLDANANEAQPAPVEPRQGESGRSIKTYTPERQADAQSRVGCRNGTIRVSTAFGLGICVDPRFASKFQTFFSALKASGARVTAIVCQAYGHAPGSNHIGGGACDVNQTAKNRTIGAMYHAGDMIRAAGLYDGCSFSDCGHVEAMRGLGNYGGTMSARRHHRHHHVRYAYR
jgi:hypothetical protein